MAKAAQQEVYKILLQFDGSCRRDENIGGAGYCIFRIKPGELVNVAGGSVALGTCGDNVEAEAEAVVSGFTRLLDIIDETLGATSAGNTPIYVQGDIQPIIRVLAHHGRLRRLDILRILEPVRFGAAHRCRKVKWIFLPREVNIVADYLAGIATRFALERLQSGRPIQVFFAPSAVRPNSPVTVEQKEDPSPFQAKPQRAQPERTTAFPPARNAVLIQARNQSEANNKHTQTKNRQKW